MTVQSSHIQLYGIFPPAVGQVYSSAIYQNGFGLIYNYIWYYLKTFYLADR